MTPESLQHARATLALVCALNPESSFAKQVAHIEKMGVPLGGARTPHGFPEKKRSVECHFCYDGDVGPHHYATCPMKLWKAAESILSMSLI